MRAGGVRKDTLPEFEAGLAARESETNTHARYSVAESPSMSFRSERTRTKRRLPTLVLLSAPDEMSA
jgi:hypothetical protein